MVVWVRNLRNLDNLVISKIEVPRDVRNSKGPYTFIISWYVRILYIPDLQCSFQTYFADVNLK